MEHPDKIIADYLKLRFGVTAETYDTNLTDQLNAIFNDVIHQHAIAHDWRFLEHGKETLVTTGAAYETTVSIKIIKSVQLEDETNLEFFQDDEHARRLAIDDDAVSSPGIDDFGGAEIAGRLYFHPPLSSGLNLYITGLIDREMTTDATIGAIFAAIPNSHRLALFSLFDFHLRKSGLSVYDKLAKDLYGAESAGITETEHVKADKWISVRDSVIGT